ncbi:MAG: hypothetical protein GY696_24515 [Gammaproteobacteria bacterium]|nr:hypothetical protein [Gammaproteobacteria bacterium]
MSEQNLLRRSLKIPLTRAIIGLFLLLALVAMATHTGPITEPTFSSDRNGLLHKTFSTSVSVTIPLLALKQFSTVSIWFLVCGVEPNPGPMSPPAWTPWDSFQLNVGSPGPLNFSIDSDAQSASSGSSEDTIPRSTIHQPVFCSINVNSLTSKLDSDIRPLLDLYEFAVLALQETKLNASIKHAELAVPNYSFFRRDRPRNGRNGGGVGLYILDCLKPKRISLRTVPNLEILAVELTSRRKRIIVASVYKPPSLDNDAFVSDFTDAVSELRAKSTDLVLMGDTNIDALSEESHLLNQSLAAFNIQQIIHEPTHLQRCLDQIFMSEDAQDCLTSGIGPPVEKHHSIVWVQLRNSSIGRPPKRTSTVWKWEDGDWARGSFLLTHWVHNSSERDLAAEILNPDLSVDEAADHLNAELFDIQSLVVPHKEVWFHRKTCPWMNKRLLWIIQRRNVAYRLHK